MLLLDCTLRDRGYYNEWVLFKDVFLVIPLCQPSCPVGTLPKSDV